MADQHDVLQQLVQELKGPAFLLRVNLLGVHLVVELRLSLPQLGKLWGWLQRLKSSNGTNGNGKGGTPKIVGPPPHASNPPSGAH